MRVTSHVAGSMTVGDRDALVNSPSVSVVAHRGSSADFPEHTLEAYVDAIEAGADGLECDVRLTADGHLVCVHDPTVERVTGARGRVAGMTLERLRGLDWGSDAGGPLTLRELFELAHDCGRRVEVAVETKHPNRYAGATEEALCDLMDAFGWLPPPGPAPVLEHIPLEEESAPTPVRVMSFSGRALARVRARSPRVPLVWLLDKPSPFATRPTLPGHAGACGLDVRLILDQPAWTAAVRAAGHALHAWTVDHEADVDRCVTAGVGTIITNRPAAVLGHLGRLPG